MWRFPEIGVPPVIIHFNGIFLYKPSSYWGTTIYRNPHIDYVQGGAPQLKVALKTMVSIDISIINHSY